MILWYDENPNQETVDPRFESKRLDWSFYPKSDGVNVDSGRLGLNSRCSGRAID